MKIKILFFIAILFLNLSNSQENTIEPVIIKKKINVGKILKKIKNQLLENSDTVTNNFSIHNQLKINSLNFDYKIHKYSIKVNSFNGNYKIKNNLIKLETKIKLDSIFNNYTEEESPIRWVINRPMKTPFYVSNFDVFTNQKEYKFDWKINSDTINLFFESSDYYTGYIKYNRKTFNIYELNYNTSKPYSFIHERHKNLKQNNDFFSKWIYKKDSAIIIFDKNNNKIKIESAFIEQEFDEFYFERYNKKGELTFNDKNYFYTKINIKNE